jgi:hypothetical protein
VLSVVREEIGARRGELSCAALLCFVGSTLCLLRLKGGDCVFEVISVPPHELATVAMELVDPADNSTDLVSRNAGGSSRVNGLVHAVYEPLLLAQYLQGCLRVCRSVSTVLEALYEYVIEFGEVMEDTGDVARHSGQLLALSVGGAIIGHAAV